MLSARVGLAERPQFRQGSALELPFDDRRFDIVWTEHVQMNISDKPGFYRELHRVLMPTGRLAADKFSNVLRNLEEGRVRVIQAVMTPTS